MRLGERNIPRERLVCIVGVWMIVTAIIISLVFLWVIPWDIGGNSILFSILFNAYGYFLAPGLLAAVGLYVAYQSTRPWAVALGTVFLVGAGMSITLGCAEAGRMIPEDYEH